jgi:hypothetical protein
VANGYNKLDKFKLLQLLEKVVKSEIDSIVNKLMERFEDEIIPYEDEGDPARPSLCREEFRQFLVDDLKENIKIVNNFIEIGVGDDKKLGFGDELDEDTTDCVKIIGTILQGISGKYVLVTSQMTGGPEGRFGKAFIMPEGSYRKEAISKGWDPEKPVWKFSNFPGLPNFFTGLDLGDIVKRINRNLGEAIKKA